MTALPSALESLFARSGLRPAQIMRSVERMSGGYLSRTAGMIENRADAIAYALYFMPEHYLKPLMICLELIERGLMGAINCGRLKALDLGSGPGTAVWALYDAALTHAPGLKIEAVLVDRSAALLDVARELSAAFGSALRASFLHADFSGGGFRPPAADAAFLCNTLSEPGNDALGTVKKTLASLNPGGVAVIVEPATAAGLDAVTALRKEFAGNCIFPCPAPGPCPMIEAHGRTCHMDVGMEVPRELQVAVTAGHRRQKFCALALAKNPAPAGGGTARLLTGFKKRPWGMEAEACDGRTLLKIEVKSRALEHRRALEKLGCGDLISVKGGVPKGSALRFPEPPGVAHKLSG